MRSRHTDIDPEILHFQVELGTEMGITIGSCLKSYVLCTPLMQRKYDNCYQVSLS